jgi:hypothetical protein
MVSCETDEGIPMVPEHKVYKERGEPWKTRKEDSRSIQRQPEY